VTAAREWFARRSGAVAGAAVAVGALALMARGRGGGLGPLTRLALWACAAAGGAVAVNELAGKPVPFLRPSFLRMTLNMRELTTRWQVGDGR
jgi:hypothetical protein